jgi:hypothetical protein
LALKNQATLQRDLRMKKFQNAQLIFDYPPQLLYIKAPPLPLHKSTARYAFDNLHPPRFALLFPGSGFTVVGKAFTSNIGENYAVSKFVVRDSRRDFLPLVFILVKNLPGTLFRT